MTITGIFFHDYTLEFHINRLIFISCNSPRIILKNHYIHLFYVQ